MKILFAKRNVLLSVSTLAVAGLFAFSTINNRNNEKKLVHSCNNHAVNHVCIMKTIFGLDTSQDGNSFSTSA